MCRSYPPDSGAPITPEAQPGRSSAGARWKRRGILSGAALVVAGVAVVTANLWPESDLVEHRVSSPYGVADPRFVRAMSSLLGPALLDGNSVIELTNGEEAFPAMLAAIRHARHSITFETYIYWEGEIGAAFAAALAERARSGVRVHVLLDWLGSQKMDDENLTQLRRAGAEVVLYRRPRWHNLGELNERTHRKLLAIDGKVGFTGGFGIADKWRRDGDDPEHWRDSHFRVEGPVVAQLQSAFMDNWLRARPELLHGDAYFPRLEPRGSLRAQVFVSSPDEGSGTMRLMYLLSIAAARRNVRIATAYFVPDSLTVKALVAARRRGVAVEIIVPGPHIDFPVSRHASHALWGPLLAAGVKIYEYQPTMYHVKLLIVDDLWVSVGSTNLDYRSFRYNDEANLNVYDADFARGQNAVLDADRARSREVTYAQWKRRPRSEKVRDRLSALLRWQL